MNDASAPPKFGLDRRHIFHHHQRTNIQLLACKIMAQNIPNTGKPPADTTSDVVLRQFLEQEVLGRQLAEVRNRIATSHGQPQSPLPYYNPSSTSDPRLSEKHQVQFRKLESRAEKSNNEAAEWEREARKRQQKIDQLEISLLEVTKQRDEGKKGHDRLARQHGALLIERIAQGFTIEIANERISSLTAENIQLQTIKTSYDASQDVLKKITKALSYCKNQLIEQEDRHTIERNTLVRMIIPAATDDQSLQPWVFDAKSMQATYKQHIDDTAIGNKQGAISDPTVLGLQLWHKLRTADHTLSTSDVDKFVSVFDQIDQKTAIALVLILFRQLQAFNPNETDHITAVVWMKLAKFLAPALGNDTDFSDTINRLQVKNHCLLVQMLYHDMMKTLGSKTVAPSSLLVDAVVVGNRSYVDDGSCVYVFEKGEPDRVRVYTPRQWALLGIRKELQLHIEGIKGAVEVWIGEDTKKQVQRCLSNVWDPHRTKHGFGWVLQRWEEQRFIPLGDR